MSLRIDMIWLGDGGRLPAWELGDVWPTAATPGAVQKQVQERLPSSSADAWLFWHGDLGAPNPRIIQQVMQRPGDVWHAGLRLGMGGQPGLMDCVSSTWMLSRDPDEKIEATSWRLSLRACLVKRDVLQRMGSVHSQFLTLEGAGLEMGLRFVTLGVLTRHIPWLIETDRLDSPAAIPFEDELRFVYYRFGRFWTRWALARILIQRSASAGQVSKFWRRISKDPMPQSPPPYAHGRFAHENKIASARVSVLIPTIDRYPYLRTLLTQLRPQTVKPLDIVVIDQTPREHRNMDLANEFRDLPVQFIYRDEPGQCTSRNAGLQMLHGDYMLLLDDDVEIVPGLIESHLQNLAHFSAEASVGVAEEVGAGPLPKNFTYTRVSDVFPAGNTLVSRHALEKSGLFDLAYERGARADGDLGMRVYLSGALIVLNPAISVLHHHAPRGGLRAHKARVITYASSRKKLTQRHLPSPTEIYLAMRYFTQRQVTEMLWHQAFGTFSTRGGKLKKLAKGVISLACLFDTLRKIRKSR
ncbi:MAG: glycosyltransferase family A protein, partial [Verrucomicrobiota bacterium]